MSKRIPVLRELDSVQVSGFRAQGEFFWTDLTLAAGGPIGEIASAYELSDAAADALANLDDGGSPARRVHVEDDLIVFAFWCATNSDEFARDSEAGLETARVNVLLHGDFLLTVHRQSFGLPELSAPGGIRADRSERYAVYVVLDGMTNTMLEALAAIESQVALLEPRLWESGWRQRPADQEMVKTLRSRLTELRVRLGPQRGLFERVGEEIEQVPSLKGDQFSYFERVQAQLDHTVDRVDAASQTLSNAVQVQLNETTYRLTLVATIFLPLSFVAGFFGMNFAWMVDHVDSAAAFWVLGVGFMVVPLAVLALLARAKRS